MSERRYQKADIQHVFFAFLTAFLTFSRNLKKADLFNLVNRQADRWTGVKTLSEKMTKSDLLAALLDPASKFTTIDLPLTTLTTQSSKKSPKTLTVGLFKVCFFSHCQLGYPD